MGSALGSLSCALAFALVALPAQASQNEDLDRIPGAVQSASPGESSVGPANKSASAAASGQLSSTETTRLSTTLHADDAATVSSGRDNLLVLPPPPAAASGWENRASLDDRNNWSAGDKLTLILSDRLNFKQERYWGEGPETLFRNDFREGYAVWEPVAQLFLELGRINIRNGLALGFNPTDFFKARTLIDQASADPSALRENRLGTVMARVQYLWSRGSLSLTYAPHLYAPRPLSDAAPNGFNPLIERTNASNRLLLTASWEIADLSPQVLLCDEDGNTRAGFNISRTIGRRMVAYAEWAGGRKAGLIERAVHYGEVTGSLPLGTPFPQDDEPGRHFRNDLAIGLSWSGARNVTLNLEYHYHQSGLSRQDWRRWYSQAAGDPSSLGAEFWYVREYAMDQQEPASRQQFFLRVDGVDAFVKNLELSGFVLVDAGDGSLFGQASAAYYLSDHWTVATFVTATAGSRRTAWGGLPQACTATLQLIRYF